MPAETIHVVHENKTFEDQTIYLDGHAYFDCTFKRCTFFTRNLTFPVMSGCRAEDTAFHLDLLVHDHEQWSAFLSGMGKKMIELMSKLPDKKKRKP